MIFKNVRTEVPVYILYNPVIRYREDKLYILHF